MTTDLANADVDEYWTAVRDALADLPADARDDLLDDLAEHLTEVLAEDEGTLRERLGDPVDYAMDLRVAAGFDPAAEPSEPPRSVQARLIAAVRRSSATAQRVDVGLGRVVGYPRAADLARALAPGWWVLRGWIVAQLVCSTRSSNGWTGFIPPLGNSRALGGAVTLALIVVSILIGRSSRRFTNWPRTLGYLTSAGIAIWGLVVLAPYIANNQYVAYLQPASSWSTPTMAPTYYGVDPATAPPSSAPMTSPASAGSPSATPSSTP